jgi:hypothetical protein
MSNRKIQLCPSFLEDALKVPAKAVVAKDGEISLACGCRCNCGQLRKKRAYVKRKKQKTSEMSELMAFKPLPQAVPPLPQAVPPLPQAVPPLPPLSPLPFTISVTEYV